MQNLFLPNNLLNKIRASNNHREDGREQEIVQSNSAIGHQLFNNSECLNNYNLDNFEVIFKGRNYFYLKTVQAFYILCLKPKLRQKKLCIRPFCFLL